MPLQDLFQAWKHSSKLHILNPPASEEEITKAENILGYKLPTSLKEIYRFSNGASLIEGNLNILPLINEENKLSLINSTAKMREWHWQIPNEVLIFGDNGGDSQFGIWLPDIENKKYINPIIEFGEMETKQCMALVGTELFTFLTYWTAYYLLLCEADISSLEDIGVPKTIRPSSDVLNDDHFAMLRKWADPNLPDYYPDPYKQRFDVERLMEVFSNL
jgi:cell wall assembly regulator SMI1